MRARLLRRYSQQELADALGVSRQTVSNWESGREEPRLKLWQTKKLCELMDWTLEQLPDTFAPQPIHTHDPAVKITTYPDV